MPSPVAEGWLIVLFVALLPILYGVAKSVANVWRKPLIELQEANKILKQEAIERTDALTEEKIRRMFLEAKVEYCEAELENWRAGKWHSGGRGSSP
jgi:hypothetical protein